jgi:DNA-directed RNA polymerase subunit RPC12/RpoP
MAEYLRNITEEDTIKCNVCNKTFRTDLITLDDWNFWRDGHVTTDCCSECSTKVLVQRS